MLDGASRAVRRRGGLAAVVAALVAVGVWLVQDQVRGDAASDAVGGLATVALVDLPPEAVDTVMLIDAGGPFPYDQDGSTFHNFEGLLPDHPGGYYREYTVDTPGSDDCGARRIVTGSEGEMYWTDDHYASFSRIER